MISLSEISENIRKQFRASYDLEHYLFENKFTYDEAQEFAKNFVSWIEASRLNYEYDTAADYYARNKRRDMSNEIVIPTYKTREISHAMADTFF